MITQLPELWWPPGIQHTGKMTFYLLLRTHFIHQDSVPAALTKDKKRIVPRTSIESPRLTALFGISCPRRALKIRLKIMPHVFVDTGVITRVDVQCVYPWAEG